MSNHLALATVTGTLRRILQSTLPADVTGADATALRPDAPSSSLPDPGVNIYLYRTAPNPSWHTADLPTRDGGGAVLQRPRIPLDLYYLLTFYGDEATLAAQRQISTDQVNNICRLTDLFFDVVILRGCEGHRGVLTRLARGGG